MSEQRRSVRSRLPGAALTAAVLALALSACAGSSAPSPDASAANSTSAGASPTAITRMICAPEAQHDIRAALGTDTTAPVNGTWRARRYSCTYVYGAGRFTLTVDQGRNEADATRLFALSTTRLGGGRSLSGLGQAAITNAAGTVVVRKDADVLTVDPSGLPARFGAPPDTRANVALTIAATIMGCWTGA